MKTLFAKLTNLSQYNSENATILYEDEKASRWPLTYGSLGPGDTAFFIGQGAIYAGRFGSATTGTSILFVEVVRVPISVDQFLSINALYPELHSRMKAQFNPFLGREDLDFQKIVSSAVDHSFIRFFILPEKQFAPADYRNGDRIILVDQEFVFTTFGRMTDGVLADVGDADRLFPVMGKTVYEAADMLRAAGEGKEGNNVRQIKRVIQKLEQGEPHQFPSFTTYYNLIHNRKAYSVGSTERQYYVGGYNWEEGSQLQRFLDDGEWENGYDGKNLDVVKAIPVGSLFALKTTARKNDEMIIMGRGVVTGNEGDGNTLYIEWEEDFEKFRVPFSGGYWDTVRRVTSPDHIKAIFFNSSMPSTNQNTLPNERISLNTILYGPPGTGKTYHTILRAANITTREDFTDRYSDAKEAYKIARDNGQIEFITFHQNYSYEDFVAGLRPNTDAGTLAFKEHKGIFYNICDRARTNLLASKKEPHFSEADFDLVWDEFLQPLRNNPSVEIALETSRDRVPFWITKENDYNLSFRKKSGGTGHTLSFRTIQQIFEGKRDYPLTGVGIYLNPVVARLRELAAKHRTETEAEPLQNYVFIIDEINRANTSRVFGELITLLEEDKRLGNAHEMEVKLPNGERFSVPSNLYIIGTMNTADKSIALIDIALRRRFNFEPMYPTREVVDNIPTVQYREFLHALNDNILKQKGADFLIGHAYFIPEFDGQTLDFETLVNNKIIPLLNEYFYNEMDSRTVFRMLAGNAGTPSGHTFVEDPYLGARCKSTGNGN